MELVIPQMKTQIKFKERKFKFTEKQQQLLKILLTGTDLELLIARGIRKGIFKIEIKKE